MCAKDPKKQSDQLGRYRDNPDRRWWSCALGRCLWKGWEMTLTPDMFPRADRLNSAGTYHLPLQGSFFPTLHLALPHLGPRRPILTGCIMSDFPLGLAHERLLQKIRWQGERAVGVLVSLPPQVGCDCLPEATALPYGYPVWIPWNPSLSSLLHTKGITSVPAVSSSRVNYYPLLVFLNLTHNFINSPFNKLSSNLCSWLILGTRASNVVKTEEHF